MDQALEAVLRAGNEEMMDRSLFSGPEIRNALKKALEGAFASWKEVGCPSEVGTIPPTEAEGGWLLRGAKRLLMLCRERGEDQATIEVAKNMERVMFQWYWNITDKAPRSPHHCGWNCSHWK